MWRRKAFVVAVTTAWIVGESMRKLHIICNFIPSLVFFALGLGVYQSWFLACLAAWPEVRRLFVKS